MPPILPERSIYQTLSSQAEQFAAYHEVCQTEVPQHQEVFNQIVKILSTETTAVSSEGQVGTIHSSPWYENPGLYNGQHRVYYSVARGALLDGVFDSDAYALNIKVTQPHPIDESKVIEAEEPVVFVTNTRFSHNGIKVNPAMRGVVVPGNLESPIDSTKTYFKEIKDTLDFIEAAAVQRKLALSQ